MLGVPQFRDPAESSNLKVNEVTLFIKLHKYSRSQYYGYSYGIMEDDMKSHFAWLEHSRPVPASLACSYTKN